jgi:hypothetical protein
MKKEERRKVGKRIKDLLKDHQCSQADLARVVARHDGISFKAASVKVSRVIHGTFEADYDFWSCLYEMFEPNIGYLIAEKGEPYVKPFK